MELGESIPLYGGRARGHLLLRARIAEIASSLEVDTTFVPTDQSGVDRLHAYRVLVHAEIEGFIEGLATTMLDVTKSKLTSGVLTHAGHHLVVYWGVSRLRTDAAKARYPPFTRTQAATDVTMSTANFFAAIESHRERVKGNHGLKAANVRQLLLPLGCREATFDTGLLDLLDDFGEKRGAVAHTSGVVGAQNWPSGSTEIARVAALLPGLKGLEQSVPRLLRPV